MASGFDMMFTALLKAAGFDKAQVEAAAREKIAEAQRVAEFLKDTATRIEQKIDTIAQQQRMIFAIVSGDKPAAEPLHGVALALMEPGDALAAVAALQAENENGSGNVSVN